MIGGISVVVLLAVLTLVVTIVSATGRCPLWVPVVLLNIIVLLMVLGIK
jgi:hypothetical protein